MKKHILGAALFGLIVGLSVGTYKILFFANQTFDVEQYAQVENVKKIKASFARISQITVYPEKAKNNIEAEIIFDDESNRKNFAIDTDFYFFLVNKNGIQFLGTERLAFFPKSMESETIVRCQTIADLSGDWRKTLKPGDNLYVTLEKRNNISENVEERSLVDLSQATPVLISKEK